MSTSTSSLSLPDTKSLEPEMNPLTVDDAVLRPKPKPGETSGRKKDIPAGLWTKCLRCSSMIYDKELDANLKVCPNCDYHFPIGSIDRITAIVDEGSFEEMDSDVVSVDVLKFKGVASYGDKLAAYKKRTGLKDAVVTGVAKIDGKPLALGVMNFGFLGGSMGSVVGEKLTRMIERGTRENMPVVIFSTSGGARMYEGMFSLMQMAKTSAALAYHAKNRLPYLSILTHPTTAGVMASYASLGDLIIAEPGAMIGFAGPRVIKDTTQAELPPGFQTAEFLMKRGLVDEIIPRSEMRPRLAFYIDFMMTAKRG